MNIPGDFVRRAAANVSSTVSTVSSTVTSVATGGRRRHSSMGGDAPLIANAKDKYNLTIKVHFAAHTVRWFTFHLLL